MWGEGGKLAFTSTLSLGVSYVHTTDGRESHHDDVAAHQGTAKARRVTPQRAVVHRRCSGYSVSWWCPFHRHRRYSFSNTVVHGGYVNVP